MSRIVKFFRVIRNNWKKSVFGTVALSYGVSYAKDKYETNQLMRDYCLKALEYGALPIPNEYNPKKIVVILNPVANKRKAKKNFEKYCAPLLNLAGVFVDVMQTESVGHACNIIEKIDARTDAVVVAGGDGTLSEVVTGMLRNGNAVNYPVGVIPLGQTNTLAKSLFYDSDTNVVKHIAEATMAVIREARKPVDVMKIEVLGEDENKPVKPVYGLGSIQWGAYRDAHAKRDKYWYWGSLRSYVTYVFTGLKSEKSGISWQCDAELDYIYPCGGCSKCFNPNVVRNRATASQPRRWWQSFLPRQTAVSGTEFKKKIDYSQVVNEECGNAHNLQISTVDLSVTTSNVYPNCEQEGEPHMKVKVGPPNVGYFSFLTEGWSSEQGNDRTIQNELSVREININPLKVVDMPEGKDQMLSIDNEDYEVRPVHVTLLPKIVSVFCKTEAAL
ncbi:acylglycerol kinase, mitochondrial [Schistocerca gregaria]|uniref:acylglycerol kinase, mitochondrial n=1 Tax=Schistocerca gregaria TaxID=7010 RepID=UPI00211E9A6F|nr:acylglycerol kinase, mitochondrial [Schistocerca gregaria]